MTGTVLVTGATGTLGREVVRLLVARGVPVRGLSRRERSGGDGVAWVVGDLVTGEGLGAAVAGVEVVIDCATSTGKKDLVGVKNLVEAAERAGVRHLVYVSIVGVDRVPIPYYRTKDACERVVRKSGLGWTVLRATQFHDLLLTIFGVSAKLPVFPVLSGVRFQPVDAPEVAEHLVELAGGAPAGYAPEVGGPRVRTYRELAEAYLRAAGRRRMLVPVRLPGAAVRALRAGGNLTPERAVGRGTFEEALAERFGDR
ncbi:NAD(P)H-binding protein [Streptomyces kaniharaensis]|uniref:NAD(P)H-binding protein n=1 Tax=Streptomyces kaniharaensis TaxID=212423 RepID=A0A6N7KRL5_9ACTN|nr:NAD(P)H-binding protein [Streptomyces kaniharaensis]MQS14262.1 NAD(P)H-binding protein [Streptomyces kaniharaensis]